MKQALATSPMSTTEFTLQPPEHLFFTKQRILKNLVVLSIGCFLSFCAYDGLAVFQSTLNREDGIGVISVSLQYGCGSLTAILFAKYFLKKYGSRSVIIGTSMSYVIYVSANLYPSWYLMIPASIIVGLSNSLFWAAECQYLNRLAILYCSHQIKRKEVEPLKDKHNIRNQYGTQEKYRLKENCNCINQNTCPHCDAFENDNYAFEIGEVKHEKASNNSSNEILSNDYEMQKRPSQNLDNEIELNYGVEESNLNSKTFEKDHHLSSKTVSDSDLMMVESTTSRMFGFHGFIFQTCHIFSNLLSYYVIKSGATNHDYIHNSTCFCGADFCNVETECFTHNLQEPSDQMRYVLLGIFVAISMLAVLVVSLFVDELEKKKESVSLSFEVLFASFRLMKNKFLILLSPYVMLVGVVQGFAMGDFTKAYIGCAWGMHHVGLVMVSFGACLSLACSISGWCVKHVGRVPIFLVGQAAIVGAGVILLVWYPDSDNPAMFFGIAGLFGVHMGILWSQLRAFYGVLFKEDEEVAFGNYNIFHSIGTSMAFGYSDFLCISTKIYIFLAISVIGCIGYLFAEKMHSISKSIK